MARASGILGIYGLLCSKAFLYLTQAGAELHTLSSREQILPR